MQKLRGNYSNMPAIYHQNDNGETVKITPGKFCPACLQDKYRKIDDGNRQCKNCGSFYSLPTQTDIDSRK